MADLIALLTKIQESDKPVIVREGTRDKYHFSYVGPEKALHRVRYALFNHSLIMKGKNCVVAKIHNMHPTDENCVDLKWLTTDPKQWKDDRENSKERFGK